jgi:hypothetical protein
MTDWDKINGEKHNEILMGRCENQALELLKTFNFNDPSVQEKYKTFVKLLYKLNMQVEEELLHGPKEKPKEIYKPCPKCQELILASWKRHDKCGWN